MFVTRGSIVRVIYDWDDETITDATRRRLLKDFRAAPRPLCASEGCITRLSAYSRPDGLCETCWRRIRDERLDADEIEAGVVIPPPPEDSNDLHVDDRDRLSITRLDVLRSGYADLIAALEFAPDEFGWAEMKKYVRFTANAFNHFMEEAVWDGVVERVDTGNHDRAKRYRKVTP